MSIAPDRATWLMLSSYIKLVEKYSRNQANKEEVLAEKSELEDLINNLTNDESYLTSFFKYISSASVSEMNFDVRVFERAIDELPPPPHAELDLNKPLELWKRYLEFTRDELKRAIEESGGGVSAVQQLAAHVASEVHAYLEAVRLLELQREVDIKNNPSQEKEINRRYRKAIDALKE